jgi:hypothetical protein
MDLAPLEAALEALTTEVEQAEAARAQAKAVLQASEMRLLQLRREREGIESYIKRHQQRDAFPPMSADDYLSPTLPRSEAVAQVLGEGDGPMTPAEIKDVLHKAGRDDEYRDVAAALSHLKSRGRANNVARGVWELVTEPQEIAQEEGEEEPDYEHSEPDDADHEPTRKDGYWDAVGDDEPPDDEDEPLHP